MGLIVWYKVSIVFRFRLQHGKGSDLVYSPRILSHKTNYSHAPSILAKAVLKISLFLFPKNKLTPNVPML